MRLSRGIVCCLFIVFAMGIMTGILQAEDYRIAVLQGDQVSAQKYTPLVKHLAKAGIMVTLVGVTTYEAAAKLIAAGQVDAMFNGPGIAGSMIVINRLKQQRSFANSEKKEILARPLMPSQNRVN